MLITNTVSTIGEFVSSIVDTVSRKKRGKGMRKKKNTTLASVVFAGTQKA
jgi:hypothetical protein